MPITPTWEVQILLNREKIPVVCKDAHKNHEEFGENAPRIDVPEQL